MWLNWYSIHLSSVSGTPHKYIHDSNIIPSHWILK